MKKLLKRSIKISLHLFSMTTLMVLVFFGGILGKLSHSENGASGKDGKDSDSDRFYSAFPINYAHADSPGGPAPAGDSDPCDGAGSSCDGPGGDGPC